jgi:hypothetical protein
MESKDSLSMINQQFDANEQGQHGKPWLTLLTLALAYAKLIFVRPDSNIHARLILSINFGVYAQHSNTLE